MRDIEDEDFDGDKEDIYTYDAPTYISFYKSGGNIAIFDPSLKNKPELLKMCESPRVVRLCVITPDTKISYNPYDLSDNKIKERPISINFALYLADELAPIPITDFTLETNGDKYEDSILVNWVKSPEFDIYKYKIYYSFSKDFKSTSEPNLNFELADNNILNKIVYDLKDYNQSKEKNTIYVAIVAMDYAGNENKTILKSIKLDLIDTIRPKMEGPITVQVIGINSVKLSWIKPTKNEPVNNEESILRDLAGYRIYDGDTLINTLNDVNVTEITLDNQDSKDHTYKIEALDETWKSADPAIKIESNEITI